MKKRAKDIDEDLEVSAKSISKEDSLFLERSWAISNFIYDHLNEIGSNQKELSHLVDKSEPEISKLLSGTHNFTIRTITRIEAALGINIISIPERKRKPKVTQTTSVAYESQIEMENWNEAKIIYIKPLESVSVETVPQTASL